MKQKPYLIPIEIIEKNHRTTAWLTLEDGRRHDIASMVTPPKGDETRRIFAELCSSMVKGMLRTAHPDAEIKIRIAGRAGHA